MRDVLQEFSNIGMRSSVRAFPGFPAAADEDFVSVFPRAAQLLTLQNEDLLSLTGGPGKLALVVLNERGRAAPEILGLSAGSPISELAFNDEALLAWAAGQGIPRAECLVSLVPTDDRILLRAKANCTVWVIYPADSADLVAGETADLAEVSVSRTHRTSVELSDPLGEVVDEFTIPRGTARAYELRKGQYVQIIDIEGQQCSDFVAFRTDALARGEELLIDSTATRTKVRQAYPRPGLLDKFYDRDARPMLQVMQDTCGRHDTFGLACTANGYEERGFPGHLNCSDNISDALSSHGVAPRAAWPAINFFWNTWVDPHSQHLLTEESHSRPGDFVTMRAMSDLVCVSTACPDDIDPINGWNPTDIHIRIYQTEAPIRRALAYRVKEDAPMTLSRESAFHPRTSALTQDIVPARNLWVAASFPGEGTLGEYWACREKVSLQDMSSLRKYDIVGPDAEHLLQHAITRDLSRLAQWRGTYALMCDEMGAVVDDGTLFRLGPQLFRWCCGSEESARRLETMSRDLGLQVRLTDMSDALVNVALQGPRSRDLLSGLVFTQPHVPALEQMKWFGVTVARLHDSEGAPFMLSRSGYTGELGYELFCAPSDALPIWDALMEQGKEFGIQPMGTAALDMIRIEAGLASAGAEFGPGIDAWEAGLGFAVDLRKSSFVGLEALERNSRDPRRMLKGLLFGANDVPLPGSPVFHGERRVGEVTSATRSPMLERGISMARLAVEYADMGTELEVGMMDGHMKRLPAKVCDIPFVDPERTRARA